MSIRKNILANYVGTGAVVIAPILALPWYLEALGASQFGLIGFIMMLQIILGLVDAGMSQALVREMSMRFGDGASGERAAADLLFGFERLYWLFALFAALMMSLLAGLISRHWLNLGDLPASLGQQAVIGASILFAVQFPSSIYRSMLVAAQAQVSLNIIMSIASLVRHLGAVLILLKWPLLVAYLGWHCAVGLLETLMRARYAWGCVSSVDRNEMVWSSTVLKNTWVLVTGMSAATLLGVLTVQMDKIILSSMAPLEQFGYYVVAASVSSGMLQMINPLIQAALPKVVQLQADALALRALSLKLFKIISVIVGIGGLCFIFSGQWLLNFWLGNEQVTAEVFPVLTLLLLGTALNALHNVGYINWLAHGKIRRVVQVNAISLILAILVIPVMISWQGIVGAAAGWIIINFIGFVIGMEWLCRSGD